MFDFGSAFLALAAWASSGGGPLESLERITPEMAVERAAKCGLGPVTIRYDDELQSDILSAPNAALATEDQLRCLDNATGFGIFVELPSGLQPRFDVVREARASALMMVEAREWLSKRGLMDRVPKYVPGTTDDATFTREVERLCGPRANGAFQSKYGVHAVSPDWVKQMGMPTKAEDTEVLSCLMNVTSVAGFKIGFIGNEAYAPAK
jgi:hypothetical protein